MNAKAVAKSINRWVKKNQIFSGGRQFGVDYATWCVSYPKIAFVFSVAARELTGREGRFMPRF